MKTLDPPITPQPDACLLYLIFQEASGRDY